MSQANTVALQEDDYNEVLFKLKSNERVFLDDRWGGKEECKLIDDKIMEISTNREVVNMTKLLKEASDFKLITNYGKLVNSFGNPIMRKDKMVF